MTRRHQARHPADAGVDTAASSYVHPGHCHVGSGAEPVTTILGSCVAICLHDPVARVGGLNHFLLPTGTGEGESLGRYAPTAVAQLMDLMLRHGARQRRLVAHVVGGASVLAAFNSRQNPLGAQNVAAADALLASLDVSVRSRCVGGRHGRKLVFTPRDGTVTIHILGR